MISLGLVVKATEKDKNYSEMMSKEMGWAECCCFWYLGDKLKRKIQQDSGKVKTGSRRKPGEGSVLGGNIRGLELPSVWKSLRGREEEKEKLRIWLAWLNLAKTTVTDQEIFTGLDRTESRLKGIEESK